MAGQDVWVIGELRSGAPSPWTLQLVSGARTLADASGGRVAVLIGDGETAELAHHGAERAVTMAGVSEGSPVEAVVASAVSVLKEERPRLALFPDSTLGRDAASQAAAALNAPLVSSCERLSFEDGTLRLIRACFGGQLATAPQADEGLQVTTVREHAFRARRSDAAGPLELSSVTPVADERITVLESKAPDPATLDLAEADVLVSGGLGVGGPEGFDLLGQLAELLGGTTAASRVAVDQGWAPRAKQVGQTGRTVAPKLYFACGISGALQHMVGVRDADTLVALNIDARAPIMGEADLAAVGDVSEVLPALLRRLSGNGSAS